MNFNDKVINTLNAHRGRITQLYSTDTGYDVSDVDFLWCDMENFLKLFSSWKDDINHDWSTGQEKYKRWEDHSFLEVTPWGNCLIVLPGNALIPLLPIIIVSFLSTGNKLEIIVPSKVEQTYNLLVQLLQPIFKNSVSFNSAGARGILSERLQNNPPNFLYYIGGSNFKHEIYSQCIKSSVDLIFEGEGKSIAVFDYKQAEKQVSFIDSMVQSKLICNGQLCTSPNTIFIPSHILEELRLVLTEKMSFIKLDACKSLTDIDSTFKYASKKGVYYLHETSVDKVQRVFNRDLFSSQSYFCGYESDDQLAEVLSSYEGGIQASIYSSKEEYWKEFILKTTSVSRIVFNKNPVYQNSLLPWGGYKKSGYSAVANFLDKSVRKVIVENYYG